MIKQKLTKFLNYSPICEEEGKIEILKDLYNHFSGDDFKLWEAIEEYTRDRYSEHKLSEIGISEIEINNRKMYIEWESSDGSGSIITSLWYDEDCKEISFYKKRDYLENTKEVVYFYDGRKQQYVCEDLPPFFEKLGKEILYDKKQDPAILTKKYKNFKFIIKNEKI